MAPFCWGFQNRTKAAQSHWLSILYRLVFCWEKMSDPFFKLHYLTFFKSWKFLLNFRCLVILYFVKQTSFRVFWQPFCPAHTERARRWSAIQTTSTDEWDGTWDEPSGTIIRYSYCRDITQIIKNKHYISENVKRKKTFSLFLAKIIISTVMEGSGWLLFAGSKLFK